ncbi:hypothetical protein FA10DRAFT_269141 [Acaromyces ingoldii]|uniref:Uncharacterized protein n=1 Tax=Acaromyces ingoldii TaxID=215250 RepID=A0A316YEL3_9BASI|nr:hypothetical protein FA10DRAFT_269141 [Acaromyces ingoldii]PWN87857.1 hypothetical protein FA10DRAFT_269141 [Acaromyces ingoldii]
MNRFVSFRTFATSPLVRQAAPTQATAATSTVASTVNSAAASSSGKRVAMMPTASKVNGQTGMTPSASTASATKDAGVDVQPSFDEVLAVGSVVSQGEAQKVIRAAESV